MKTAPENVTPVVEASFARFKLGAISTLNTDKSLVFANSLAPSGKTSGFNFNRIDIRNNGGYNLWVGWVAGRNVTGKAISTITRVDGKILITSAAHGLVDGQEIIIAGEATDAAGDNLHARGKFKVLNAATDTFNIAEVSTPTTAMTAGAGGIANGTTGAYWYTGYTSGEPGVQHNISGTASLAGKCVEPSTFANDEYRLPMSDVAALFICNQSGSNLTDASLVNYVALWG